MAAVPQKTLSWLYDVLKREYHDPNRTYSDLAQTLSQYPGLSPRTDVYTSENGMPALLLNLKGVLPVNFRGTIYQFPVSIWVPHAYPFESPIVFVTPTEGMVVRPGQHVSAADGRVYHHYLAQWKEAHNRSSVAELSRILTDIFAREPPVMARPQHLPQQQQQSPRQGPPPKPPPQDQRQYSNQISLVGAAQPGAPPPPPPPPPKHVADGSRLGSTGSPSPAPGQSRYDAPPPLPPQAQSPRPAPPPKPYGNGNAPQPGTGVSFMPQRQSSLRQEYSPRGQPPAPSHQYGAQSPGRSSTDQRPLPPLPPQSPTYSREGALPQSTAQNHPPQYQQPPAQHTHLRPQQYPQQPQPQGQAQSQSQSQSQHCIPLLSPQGMPQQPGQPHLQQQQIRQQPPPTFVPPQQTYPPKPAAPKDLLSEDDPFQVSLPSTTQPDLPAPSIPANPEKTALLAHLSHLILSRLHASIQGIQTSAIPSLSSQHAALTAASQTLNTEMSQLQPLHSQLQSNISALQATLNSANNTIKSTSDPKHPSHPDNIPPIDQIIIPPTVVARQLYDAVAEQRGYEAAIFALNEAFVRSRIGSEVWGRKVRECAREEMKRKWLVRRIGEGLGLEEP